MKLHNKEPHPNPPRLRGGDYIFPGPQAVRGLRGGVKFYATSQIIGIRCSCRLGKATTQPNNLLVGWVTRAFYPTY
jgi:hypothetical protein